MKAKNTNYVGREVFFPTYSTLNLSKLRDLTPNKRYKLIRQDGHTIQLYYILNDIGIEVSCPLNFSSAHLNNHSWKMVGGR
jgi:hypothetical protein